VTSTSATPNRNSPNHAEARHPNWGDVPQSGEDAPKPIYKRPFMVAAGIAVLIAIITAATLYLLYERSHEWTDDAFIDGHATRVAPQVSGRVLRLLVDDNQQVKAGDLLIEIDPRDYQAKLAQTRAQAATARSQLAQARAQLAVQSADAEQAAANVRVAEADAHNATDDLTRYRSADRRAVSRQQMDNALAAERTDRAKLDASRQAAGAAMAQVEAAKAEIANAEAAVALADAQTAEAELQLSYTKVVAAVSGRITMRTVEVGNYVNPGDQMMAIVDPKVWVTANYKETQLTHMQPGQPVEIDVDTYPSVTFHGKVDSIQRGSGSYFSALPAENATGNYVKVVQRVPVKIVFDDDRAAQYLLAPGMSVEPTVKVR